MTVAPRSLESPHRDTPRAEEASARLLSPARDVAAAGGGCSDFFVVVPCYNEAASIGATLAALAAQSDREFVTVLVDNGSTDETVEVAKRFARVHPAFELQCVPEPQKGTGAASDSGARWAIRQGARYIARTDADCLPDHDWVRNIKRAFREEQLDFIAGAIKPRGDQTSLTLFDRVMIPALVFVATTYGKLHRRGPQFKRGYLLVAGNNLAITASMYLEAGGLPRSRIKDLHEDRELFDRVRMRTAKAAFKRDVIVYNSVRRLRRYGYVRTLLWYWDHKYRPRVVDVR